jgi:4-hydroxythreonine-4-phosphate dehydrogenase
MKKAENIIVGISIGDLNGIVVLKAFEDTRMLELCTPVIFAKLLSFVKKSFQSDSVLHGIDKLTRKSMFKCLKEGSRLNLVLVIQRR